jgi:hypothetical protein
MPDHELTKLFKITYYLMKGDILLSELKLVDEAEFKLTVPLNRIES